MATKKITDLVELTSAASGDVLPIVDISDDITKKISASNLLATKQDTLVSGTNIKTINSTSILGSGDIAISASPSGGAGAIQFSDGSAFASDTTNLFWDNTNKRLGIGTNAPGNTLRVVGSSRLNNIYIGQVGNTVISNTNSDTTINLNNGVAIAGGSSITPTARLQVKGSGSTSATTSLLVQNSAGTELFKVRDDGLTSTRNNLLFSLTSALIDGEAWYRSANNASVNMYGDGAASSGVRVTGSAYSNGASQVQIKGATSISSGLNQPNASAQLDIQSTTQGFLPPRMTTTQKNAISTPAAGLQLWDTDTSSLQVTNGTDWFGVGFGSGGIGTNTAVGNSALDANTTGTSNTAVGQAALGANTTGTGNTAIGDSSLKDVATGSNNTALGWLSLFSNKASNNTAVGFEAARNNFLGTGITAIGYQALRNSTGGNNTAVGQSALVANTTGNSNTAVGANALQDNNTGFFNGAVGQQALERNTSGANNNAFGFRALRLNTTGSNNMAIGQSALLNNTAYNNTAVGYESATSNTTGTSITAIGYQALRLSTGNNNTALGFQAGDNITTGAGNVCIGSGAEPENATDSNKFVVGTAAVNAGAVTTETISADTTWTVRINGANYKIPMLAI